MQTHYKGIHPVRVSDELQSLLIDLVLKYKDKLFRKMDYELFYNNDRPYFCNKVYMIKTETYKKIIEDSSLFVDKFDEVNYHKESDLYEDMDYTKLKEMAIEKGINAHFVKRDELVQKLNKAE